MASFTPQEIEQFLQQFFDVVGTRQYIGARYVPIFGRKGESTIEWDNLAPYEPLTVVMHQGVSYVSKQYVPKDVEITDTNYWAETYRFNAQVEQYRQEVLQFQSQIDQIREDMESDYVPFPDSDFFPKYGIMGQVLTTLSNGTTKWEDPVTVDAAIAEPLIEEWLDSHPEATTTVEDGAITLAKLNDALVDILWHHISMSQSIATDTYSNLASNLPKSSICYTSRTWFSDLPTDMSGDGFLITVGNVAGNAFGSQILLCTASNNRIYYRGKRNNTTFNEWVKIDMAEIYTYFGSMSSTDDLNDINTRGFYYAQDNGTPLNSPTSSAFFMRVDRTTSVTSQTVFQVSGDFTLYNRIKIGSNEWTDWNVIYKSYQNAGGMYYAFGDSTTRGSIGGQITNYGYPRITADKLGIKVTNLGVSGQGLCKDWDTINSTIDGLDMSDATLITVGWGYNDGSTWATLNRGDYTDTTDTTVIGRYYTIMKKLQQKCQNAVVVLVTTYGSPGAVVDGKASLIGQFTNNITFLDRQSTWGDFFDELEKMCHLHGWPCVNQHKNCALNEFNAPSLLSDQIHPNVNGYWIYGNNLAAQISGCYANIIPRGF